MKKILFFIEAISKRSLFTNCHVSTPLNMTIYMYCPLERSRKEVDYIFLRWLLIIFCALPFSLNAQPSIEQFYKDIIKKADIAFDEGKWELSDSLYREANKVKPDEQYPKDKIISLQSKIKHQNEFINDQFTKMIAVADENYKKENYNEALKYYKRALKLKPEEKYVKKMIRKTKKKVRKETVYL